MTTKMTAARLAYLLTAIYAIVIIAYIISWFVLGQGPSDLLYRATWLYGLSLPCCGALCAYEYKCQSRSHSNNKNERSQPT